MELLMVPTLLTTDDAALPGDFAGDTCVLGAPVRLDLAEEVAGDWVVRTAPLLVMTIWPTLLACTSWAPRIGGE